MSLIRWLTAFMSYTKIALVEDGASLGSRQLDMGNSGGNGHFDRSTCTTSNHPARPSGLRSEDLLNPERKVKGGNKLVWGLVIVFINLIGPLVYLVAGREED